MQVTLTVSVWIYLMAATVVEVMLYYLLPASTLINLSIGLLAASKAVLIVMYFMHLKYEPRPIQYLILPPTLLVAVLILTLIFSVGH